MPCTRPTGLGRRESFPTDCRHKADPQDARPRCGHSCLAPQHDPTAADGKAFEQFLESISIRSREPPVRLRTRALGFAGSRTAGDAQNQLLRIRNASGQEQGLIGSGADITMGGNGANADLTLKDSVGIKRIALIASAPRVRLHSADGGTLTEIGPNGNLLLGGAAARRRPAAEGLRRRDAAPTRRPESPATNPTLGCARLLVEVRRRQGGQVHRRSASMEAISP